MIPWLLACTGEPTGDGTLFVPLGDARLARRLSVDIRGVLPSVEETERATSGELDALVDEWIESPAFEAHLAEAYTEDWLLDVDVTAVLPAEFGFHDQDDAYAFSRTFGQEPARLVAHVAATDRPWTDIVTADWTMANDMLAEAAPLEWVDADDTSEWREARYVDGRPAGGVVMTSGLWFRYSTTLSNFNRGRAANLAWLLLCYDFLTRPVDFSSSQEITTDELRDAVSTDPGCLACHATLDPLAGNLFGFWPYENKDGRELVTYHAERERWGVELTGMEPAYFGTPLASPAQLGPMIAQDPRFSMCTATRTAGRLWGRTVTYDDLPQVVVLRDTLEADWQYKALLRAVLATDEYRAGRLVEGASEADLDRAHPVRWMSPFTLGGVVEDLTGFRWTYEGWDQLESDKEGFRTILGGADGDLVIVPNLRPGVSRSLAIQRLAEAAAAYIVPRDLALPQGERTLLATDVAEVPQSAGPALDAALTTLHLRLFSVAPDAGQLSDEGQLFADVLAISDATTAWQAVVSVLLRDPELWSY